MTKHALLNDQLRLEGRRSKLKGDIERFQATARGYLGHVQYPAGLQPAYTGDDWEDIEEDPDVNEPLARDDPPMQGNHVDATARDGKPNPLNEREAKAELWGRGLPVQRGTALENDKVGGGGGGRCREGGVRARLNSTGCTRENGT